MSSLSIGELGQWVGLATLAMLATEHRLKLRDAVGSSPDNHSPVPSSSRPEAEVVRPQQSENELVFRLSGGLRLMCPCCTLNM